jgi:hypothetical protein
MDRLKLGKTKEELLDIPMFKDELIKFTPKKVN